MCDCNIGVHTQVLKQHLFQTLCKVFNDKLQNKQTYSLFFISSTNVSHIALTRLQQPL
jgi:hypothetical protein